MLKKPIIVSLVIAIVLLRLSFDYMGATGRLYDGLPEEALDFAGVGSKLSLEMLMIFYFTEMFLFYVSLILFIRNSKSAVFVFLVCFLCQLIMTFSTGLYVSAPLDSTISWLFGSLYAVAFGIALCDYSNTTSKRE